jgi:hypothetical protein
MKISRRNFLGAMSGSAVTLWSVGRTSLGVGPRPEGELDCALLDLESDCVLRESLQGYQSGLASKHTLLPQATLDSQCRCSLVIVPGLGSMNPAIAGTLTDLLQAGTHVLLESGAGFLSAAEFGAHQRMLRRSFDLVVGPPVDVWSGWSADHALSAHHPGRHPKKKVDGRESMPYVTYIWPRETKVRDFSRVIPVTAGAGEVIGRTGTLSVAWKWRVAKGTLIFLGSPLGPTLGAGDPEARSWLQLVMARAGVAGSMSIWSVVIP